MATAQHALPRPEFVTPYPDAFLYLGLSVDPRTRGPLVRPSPARARVLEHCRSLATEWQTRDGVREATVFESTVLPPLSGIPRVDVMLLVRAESSEALTAIKVPDVEPAVVMAARNARRIGETGRDPAATYLFNHFTAPGDIDAVTAWEELAAWYTAVLGVDNSVLLKPTDDDTGWALVNHVRIPGNAARFGLGQFLRPSFHTFVRPRLRAQRMAAMPVLGRIA